MFHEQLLKTTMEVIVILLSTLLDGLAGQHFDDNMRMLNGTPAKLGQFPFAADFSYGCSGSVITAKHCLTAAHCFSSVTPSSNLGRVMVGDVNFRDNKPQAESRQYRNITKVILYPDYATGKSAADDIAVAIVEKPFELGVNVAVIPLASKQVEEGSSVISLGFGYQTRGNDSLTVPTETNLAWDYYTVQGDWCKGRRNVICIEHPYRGPYHGDSGGPLINKLKNPELLGVASAIISSSNPPHTAIYASVPHKRDWILKQIDAEKTSKRSVGLKVCLEPFFVYFELIILMKDF